MTLLLVIYFNYCDKIVSTMRPYGVRLRAIVADKNKGVYTLSKKQKFLTGGGTVCNNAKIGF